MSKYFLYARKSTDVEDKQVRSIDDQLAVLRALAKEQGLNIVREFTEKRSAKTPGRPVFDEMMSRIERGEAQGVLCWKLDRLARNMADGGKIIEWVLQSVIRHIRTFERDYYPTDNVLLMCVEFGIANQYSIDLSSNTKRGLYEKVKRGEYPGFAPVGYLNDQRTKLVVVCKRLAEIVRRAFELYAEGNKCLDDIANFFFENGIKTKATKRWQNGGYKPMKRDKVSYILSNPFYIGLFRYGGELHEGKHEPIISKELFDKVQAVLKARSKPPTIPTKNPQALCGLIRCGTCGMMVTAAKKIKRQKNGNVHEYVYYWCTRKDKTIKCNESPIREEELDRQLTAILKNYVLPSDWAAELNKMTDKEEREAVQSSGVLVQEAKDEMQGISEKLQRLLSAYLDQDIEREAYRSEKASLLSHKKSLEEKIGNLEQGAIGWIEPLRNWIKDAQTLGEITETTPLPVKKSFALKIFGLNPSKNSFGLTLHAREARGYAENQWAAIAAAHCNFSSRDFVSCLVGEERVELS